jgi:hypothetical protein
LFSPSHCRQRRSLLNQDGDEHLGQISAGATTTNHYSSTDDAAASTAIPYHYFTSRAQLLWPSSWP